MGINLDKKTGFISTAKAGIFSAIVAVGAGVSAPAASSQQLEMELLDMVGMGDVSVSGFVSLTNTVFWRGISLTPDNGFGVNAAIHAGIGNGGYLGFFGTNYGLGATDGVMVAYGGYANSIGDTGLGYNVGASYFYHFGSNDATIVLLDGTVVDGTDPGTRTADSERRSFFEIHLAGSYTDPWLNTNSNIRVDFDFYHNGPIFGAALDLTDAVNPANNGDAYWAIHISGGQSYTFTAFPLTVGWFAGGYAQPLLVPTSFTYTGLPSLANELSWTYGGIHASYNIGHGLSIGLRGFWNGIPVRGGTDAAVLDSAVASIATGSGGHWSFTLTKSF